MRGKLDELQSRISDAGLIPACAGKTTHPTNASMRNTAHPRVCGENLIGGTTAALMTGSSPRVRGKRGPSSLRETRRRLIPACAGKTVFGPRCPTYMGAHPRVCGENVKLPASKSLISGSSPRVRGKRRFIFRYYEERGLIPACAGKTSLPQCSEPQRRAHPRVCGENPTRSRRIAFRCGSSPRVRGKLMARGRHKHPEGLIPACAGKTSSASMI